MGTKVLSLDLSLSAGWALLEDTPVGPKLLDYGRIEAPELDKTLKYPKNNIVRVFDLATDIFDKVTDCNPDIIVIEQLNRGMNRHSQTLLAFIHYSVLYALWDVDIIDKVQYIDTSEWRKVVGLSLTKEQRKQNQTLSRAKSQAKRDGKPLDKKKLGITGKITKKHLAVDLVFKIFGVTLGRTQDDEADAILQALSYLKGAKINQGK